MFTNLLGNNEAKETLRRLVAGARLPGSLLFIGDEGIGKKLFALEFAKILNCRNRVGVEACDECSSCKRISRSKFPPFGNADDDKERIIWSEHADVAMVRPYKQIIRVSPIRELEREANFRPFEGAGRVFIIEDADYMNDQASNALLKSLEEPQTSSHLILTTPNPTALLATIRSRCQVIRFAPIPVDELESFLIQSQELADSDAKLLARLARGSLGRALNADLETYRERRAAMLAVLKALTLTGNAAQLLRAAEEMAAGDRDEYELTLEVLETLIRDAWALRLERPSEGIINIDLLKELKAIAGEMQSRHARAWLQAIEELRGTLEVNINRRVAGDALFLAMASA